MMSNLSLIDCETNAIKAILTDNLNVSEDEINFILKNIVNGCHQEINRKAKQMKVELNWCNENYITVFTCYFSDIKMHLDPKSHIGSSMLIDGLQKYIDGSPDGINPAKIATLLPEEMSENIQKFIDPIQNRDVDYVDEHISNRYRCNACQEKKTRIRQVQTKSLDEGTSLLITCVECNNSWIK